MAKRGKRVGVLPSRDDQQVFIGDERGDETVEGGVYVKRVNPFLLIEAVKHRTAEVGGEIADDLFFLFDRSMDFFLLDPAF